MSTLLLIVLIVVAVLVLLVAGVVFMQLPELRRYKKIRAM